MVGVGVSVAGVPPVAYPDPGLGEEVVDLLLAIAYLGGRLDKMSSGHYDRQPAYEG